LARAISISSCTEPIGDVPFTASTLGKVPTRWMCVKSASGS